MRIYNWDLNLERVEEHRITIERLRYLAIDYEYWLLFENMTKMEIEELSKTPEECFIEVYENWKYMKSEEVEKEFIETYGEDMLNDWFRVDKRSTKDIKEKMDEKYREIKNKFRG